MHFSSLFSLSPYFIYLIILIVLYTILIFNLPNAQRKKSLLMVSGWISLIIIVVIGYSFKNDFLNARFMAYVWPGYGYIKGSHSVSFSKASDEHFYIIAEINNRYIKFLVDTGASDIILTPQDASKIGIDVKKLKFTKVYNTANGQILAAPVIIPQLKIKDFKAVNVKANVTSGDLLDKSLLGMSFLENYSFFIKDDTLTIDFF